MVKDVGVLSPYKDELVPLLQGCVSDPTPTVRTVAARALGNLVGTMGEESFPGLIDWLLEQMQDKESAPTRSGGPAPGGSTPPVWAGRSPTSPR